MICQVHTKKIVEGKPADYTTALQKANLTLPKIITEDQFVILRRFLGGSSLTTRASENHQNFRGNNMRHIFGGYVEIDLKGTYHLTTGQMGHGISGKSGLRLWHFNSI
jgi:hypothetical protein